jgi:hypothetical protein
VGFNRVLRRFFAWRLVIVEASRCQGVDAWRRAAAWRCVAPLRTAAPKMVTSGVCGHLAMIQCMVAFTFIPPPPPPANQPTNQPVNQPSPPPPPPHSQGEIGRPTGWECSGPGLDGVGSPLICPSGPGLDGMAPLSACLDINPQAFHGMAPLSARSSMSSSSSSSPAPWSLPPRHTSS